METLINSLMERVCLQLQMIARRKPRAHDLAIRQGMQHSNGEKRCAASLQHLAIPTRPTSIICALRLVIISVFFRLAHHELNQGFLPYVSKLHTLFTKTNNSSSWW